MGNRGVRDFRGPPEIKNQCISASAASILTAVLSVGFMALKYEIFG